MQSLALTTIPAEQTDYAAAECGAQLREGQPFDGGRTGSTVSIGNEKTSLEFKPIFRIQTTGARKRLREARAHEP